MIDSPMRTCAVHGVVFHLHDVCSHCLALQAPFDLDIHRAVHSRGRADHRSAATRHAYALRKERPP